MMAKIAARIRARRPVVGELRTPPDLIADETRAFWRLKMTGFYLMVCLKRHTNSET